MTPKPGDTFGRLTVIRVYTVERIYDGRIKTLGAVDAVCSCGTQCKGIMSRGLVRGSTKSCGCLRIEMAKALNVRRFSRERFALGLGEVLA